MEGRSAAPGYGRRIKIARVGANKTRAQFAAALGVHYNTVARWEQENQEPHDTTLFAIARLTKRDADWLLYGDTGK